MHKWCNFLLDIQNVVCIRFQPNSIHAGVLTCAELKSDRIIIPNNRYSEFGSPNHYERKENADTNLVNQ